MRWQVWALAGAAVTSAVVFGCTSSTVENPTPGYGPTGGSAGTGALGDAVGMGEACDDQTPCRAGLVCEDAVCAAGHATAEGGDCVVSGECEVDLQCVAGLCAAAGGALEGEGCMTSVDCASGLRCAMVGMGLSCVTEGSADLGGECEVSEDCLGGLDCVEAVCAVGTGGFPVGGFSLFAGVECDEPATENIRAYFEIPGAPGEQAGDFFRLPYPNDIRLVDGRPDLSQFPTPGTGPGGVDLVQLYVDAVSADADGWSAYPTVHFRFSGPIDFTTFDHASGGTPPTWVDITPGAAEYGANAGNSFGSDPNDRKYYCHDSITVRRPMGRALLPGHTYAVWLSTASRAGTDPPSPIERSPHLEAMLASVTPTDPVLAEAHAKYEPLRAYLSDDTMTPPAADDILNVAVFTVGSIDDPMVGLAAAVDSALIPSTTTWVRCADGVDSPCPQAEGDRACGSGANDYDEYHALVRLPIFQEGTAPYVESGGNVVADDPQRYEEVCMALTVPTTVTMPATGWPLVVYAHGTGGSFRSHVQDSVAGALTQAATPDGTPVPFAVLGIDQVLHGPRRGDSTASPNQLFANYLNPQAARGNTLQGASDQIALARFAATLDAPATETDGDAIRIDPDAIVFFGHSQGATQGSLALPYVDTYRAAVLSGNGAGITHSLLGKTGPVNIAAAIPLALGDVTPDGILPGGAAHPVIGLIQHWMDPADPLNFARLIGLDPLETASAKHVLQPYGLNDTMSPPDTLNAFAIAAGLAEAEPDVSVTAPDPIRGVPDALPVPLSGNITVDDIPTTTLVVRQYAMPDDGDGHFVVFHVPGATADAVRFLAMGAAGQLPQVGE